jgi:hypothetical protein
MSAPLPPPLDPALRDAVRASILSDLRPAPARSLASRAALVLAGALLGCGVAAVSFGKKLGAVVAHPLEDVVGLVAVGVSAYVVARALAPRSRASARSKLTMSAVLALLWFAFLAFLADGGAPGPHAKATSCLMVSSIGGLIAAAAALYAFRKTDPWAPRQSGALLGAAAGLVGAAGVGITCVYREGGHLAVGHALSIPLLALLGAALGKRVLRP